MTSLSESQLSLNVNNLEACGVEACLQPNGETWLCLTLRFPVIAGIQLPEDDVVQIQCRPQDRSQSVDKQISVGTSGLDQLIANAFVGDDQKFQCEVALFRQTPGSELFSTLVKPNDVIPLGEELHLRSIVRSGDGWEFSKLTDVSVHRVIGQGSGSDERVSVPLLLDDGCRNNAFQILAPKLPVHHKKTQLITNFPFRVFAFQGMNSGDRLEVTARVTGCVEAVDCVPSQCADGLGAGRRRRRRRSMFNQENNNNSSSQPGIKEWSTDMSFGVVLPSLTNRVVDSSSLERPLMGCPAPLLGSLLAAIASSTLLLGLLVYVCIVRRTKHLNKLNSTLEGSMTHSVIFSDNGSTTNHTLPARPEGSAVLGTPNSSAQSVLRCRRKRSFSADAASRRHKHVNIITVPALPQENLYSELDTNYSMQPTFV